MTTTHKHPLIGAHMPVAGGVYNAVVNGHAIGCESVQVFTASPRQWRSPKPTDEALAKYKAACKEYGMCVTVAHDSYLINLAVEEGRAGYGGGDSILEKSRVAFRGELDRAEAFGIDFLVSHPGAHMGAGIDVGIERIVKSIDVLHQDTAGYHVKVALENTAGQGTTMGYEFEQIERIIAGVRDPDRLVVCLDTCHLLAAGYDIRTEAGYQETMDKFDRTIGMSKLAVVHANDSEKPLGSKVDRHTHIGDGQVGIDAFRCLVNDPRLAGIPVIVETPDADEMHVVNVKRLKDLIVG